MQFSDRNDLMVFVGAIAVMFGSMVPLIDLGVAGTVSYQDVGGTKFYLLLLAAASGIATLFVAKRNLTIFSAIGVWVIILWPMVQGMFESNDSGAFGKLAKTATDPIKNVASDLLFRVSDFSWGGYLLLIGLLVFTVGAVMTFMANRKG